MERFASDDTISAIATAPGEGGVAIVRVSGKDSPSILKKVFRPKKSSEMKPSRMRYGHIVSEDGEVIDEVLCVYFRAPNTYTAEDVCEIQCHGGMVQARRVFKRTLEAGARIAGPGEFTRRAFENGRITLPEAEAVLCLVRSNGELAARSALRQLSGLVSAFIVEIRKTLTSCLSLIEATIDFPDEVEEKEAEEKVLSAVNESLACLNAAIDEDGARAVREGASVVIAGNPNVGKSSLLNAILRRDRAIVSEIPGTTRDVLTEKIQLNGLSVELSDTAGVRESTDPIEAIGISRALKAQREADLVFLIFDASRAVGEDERKLIREKDAHTVFVVNKSDIADPETVAGEIERETGIQPVCVSAATYDGVDTLIEIMKRRLSGYICAEPILIGLRQIECAKRAREALLRAREAIFVCPLDLVSSDIWEALEAIASLAGDDAREDVIDSIFKDFCVGK